MLIDDTDDRIDISHSQLLKIEGCRAMKEKTTITARLWTRRRKRTRRMQRKSTTFACLASPEPSLSATARPRIFKPVGMHPSQMPNA